jgi:hypothetical protein
MWFWKKSIDQLHLYHEIDDDHRIVVEDGTFQTIGEYINKWKFAHF